MPACTWCWACRRASTTRRVAHDAQRAGVATRPLSMYYLRPAAAESGLLLGYGAVREEEIGPSFARLAGVLRGHLRT